MVLGAVILVYVPYILRTTTVLQCIILQFNKREVNTRSDTCYIHFFFFLNVRLYLLS